MTKRFSELTEQEKGLSRITVASAPTIRGIETDHNGREAVYFGLTYRIPKVDYPDKLDQYLDKESERAETFMVSLDKRYEIGEIFERYEVIDCDTEDVLVMWRIPVYLKRNIQ